MIHIYCGEGKGKTTAAVGLCVRAVGAGKRALFVQFFKNGVSSEVRVLQKIDNVRVLFEPKYFGRVSNMTPAEREESRRAYTHLFERCASLVRAGEADVVVLDEIVSACNHGVVEEEKVLAFLDEAQNAEVILTGRGPDERLLRRADYVTEMVKRKHPYDLGITARKGIEF